MISAGASGLQALGVGNSIIRPAGLHIYNIDFSMQNYSIAKIMAPPRFQELKAYRPRPGLAREVSGVPSGPF
jgi:hypothetical protein